MSSRKRRRSTLDPPPALVELLQSDASVLRYFQNLHSMVQSDVEKYKRRAAEAHAESEALRAQVQSKTKRAPKKTTTTKTSPKKPPAIKGKKDADVRDMNDAPLEHVQPLVLEQGQAIDDDMFEMESSSEDEEPERVDATDQIRQETDCGAEACEQRAEAGRSSLDAVGSPHLPSLSDAERAKVLDCLYETFQGFERLGVSFLLVESEEGDGKNKDTDAGEADNRHCFETSTLSSAPTPLADHVVAAQIYDSIHQVCRIHMECPTLLPFDGFDFAPASHNDDHPAAQVERLLNQHLLTLYTLCSDHVTVKEWSGWFRDKETTDEWEHIRVGFYGRRRMVQDMMDSLAGEIVQGWPKMDRAMRYNNAGLLMDLEDVRSDQDGLPTMLQGSIKTQTRLALLLERRVLVDLLVHFYLHTCQSHRVLSLFLTYLRETVPCLAVEQHPAWPPVCSALLLEAMIVQDNAMLEDPLLTNILNTSKDATTVNFHAAVSLALSLVASIHGQRMMSRDFRILNASLIERAAFGRLCVKFDWLASRQTESPEKIRDEAHQLLGPALCRRQSPRVGAEHIRRVTLELLIVLTTSPLTARDLVKTCSAPDMALEPVLSAIRSIELRRINEYVSKVGSQMPLGSATAATLSDIRIPSDEGVASRLAALECLVDASALQKFIRDLPLDASSLFDALERNGNHCSRLLSLIQRPLARVINLRSRKDRIAMFVSQSMREELIVCRGPLSIKNSAEESERESLFDGLYALDGRGSKRKAQRRLINFIGSTKRYFQTIQTEWRPNNLRAFDQNAPETEDVAEMSMTEQACAISHVASWLGARMSLTHYPSPSSTVDRLLFNLGIAGYAKGAPLASLSSGMDPSPVCLILEDDAILHDRFTDRLKELLEELPRDFHFCTLGYARPKTAPIVKLSDNVGIPTCLYYMTGYIISLEGIQYLMDSLPIVGPIDVWVGLKMVANWDNTFGVAVGLGNRHRPYADLPASLAEVAKILSFRAYCALQPLCEQRVANSAAAGAYNRPVAKMRHKANWRNRDTDIEYSGNV